MEHDGTSATQPATGSRAVYIFANPIAGRGAGEQVARALEARLGADGYEMRRFLCPPLEVPASELREWPHAAIVIGGDGTLRSAIERMLCADMLPPVMLVPMGTANMMGKYLGIRWNRRNVEETVSRAIADYRVRLLDGGRANGRLFIQVVGVGYDAHVIYELARARRGPISFRHYLLPAFMALRAYSFVPIRVTLDGEEIFPEQPGLAFVGNLSQYGTGFPILRWARPDDGLLDVCVAPCRSRSQLINLFTLAAVGQHTEVEGVIYRKGKHVRIESARPLEVQADGDPAGHTPVQIDLLPVKLPFIVTHG